MAYAYGWRKTSRVAALLDRVLDIVGDRFRVAVQPLADDFQRALLTGGLKDATIERRFKRYGEWAGLAFWLYLTRDWVEDGLPV